MCILHASFFVIYGFIVQRIVLLKVIAYFLISNVMDTKGEVDLDVFKKGQILIALV